MVEKIVQYLSQAYRDYDEGIILLSKTTKNRVLLQRLTRKPWPEKLYYELEKYIQKRGADIPEPVQQKKRAIEPVTTAEEIGHEFTDSSKRLRIIRGTQKVNYDDLPRELQLKWDENAAMYKEARSLHEKLKLMADSTDDKRQPIIARLDQLSDSVRENWNVIDNYDPLKKEPEAEEIVLDHKKINADRKYISANLKKFETNPKDNKLKKNIQDRITELVKAKISFSEDQVQRLKNLGFEMGYQI